MANAARIVSGIVVEVATLPAGFTVEECFHPDAGFVACDGSIAVGMTYSNGEFGPVPPAPQPSLASLRAQKISALYAKCDSVITGGYTSSALGAPHTYPSSQTDQMNMMASVTASLLPNLQSGWTTPFWCADASGAWSMAQHTTTQIQQAGSDGKAFIVAAQEHLAVLTAQVNAAADAAAVAAIDW